MTIKRYACCVQHVTCYHISLSLLLRSVLSPFCLFMITIYGDWIRRNKETITRLSTPQLGSKDLYFATKYSQSFFNQCVACLWKQHLSYWRNPAYTAVRFLFTTMVALLFGTIFWDMGSKR